MPGAACKTNNPALGSGSKLSSFFKQLLNRVTLVSARIANDEVKTFLFIFADFFNFLFNYTLDNKNHSNVASGRKKINFLALFDRFCHFRVPDNRFLYYCPERTGKLPFLLRLISWRE